MQKKTLNRQSCNATSGEPNGIVICKITTQVSKFIVTQCDKCFMGIKAAKWHSSDYTIPLSKWNICVVTKFFSVHSISIQSSISLAFGWQNTYHSIPFGLLQSMHSIYTYISLFRVALLRVTVVLLSLSSSKILRFLFQMFSILGEAPLVHFLFYL